MSIKILVVDDNSDILANVAEYLEMKGWIVECSPVSYTHLTLPTT